jgi:hypothetical protein
MPITQTRICIIFLGPDPVARFEILFCWKNCVEDPDSYIKSIDNGPNPNNEAYYCIYNFM